MCMTLCWKKSIRAGLGLVVVAGLASGCATVAPATPASSVSAPITRAEPETAPAADAVLNAPGTAQPEPATPPTVQVSLKEFVEHNDDRLLLAYVGMSRQNVDRLMNGHRSGTYSNPFRQQSISLVDGKRYDVLYYLTRAPNTGKGITETMLTPVILKNDRIVAIGRYPLKKLRRGECPASKPSACQ